MKIYKYTQNDKEFHTTSKDLAHLLTDTEVTVIEVIELEYHEYEIERTDSGQPRNHKDNAIIFFDENADVNYRVPFYYEDGDLIVNDREIQDIELSAVIEELLMRIENEFREWDER
jgi:hypothetical protein